MPEKSFTATLAPSPRVSIDFAYNDRGPAEAAAPLLKPPPTRYGYFPLTACRTMASVVRRSSMAICPGAELLLPTAKVAAEP